MTSLIHMGLAQHPKKGGRGAVSHSMSSQQDTSPKRARAGTLE